MTPKQVARSVGAIVGAFIRFFAMGFFGAWGALVSASWYGLKI